MDGARAERQGATAGGWGGRKDEDTIRSRQRVMFLKGMCEGSKARGYPMAEDVSGEGVHGLWSDHRVRDLLEHVLQGL